jgi:hypothetical protein
MRVFHRVSRAVLALTVVLLLISAYAQQRVASRQNEFVPRFVTLRPTQPVDVAQAETDALNGAALPTWNGSFIYNSVGYPFTMLGNKIVAGAGTTTIDVILIPLRLAFADGTVLDATRKVCGGSESPLRLTKRSPLFRNLTWAPGGTNVGTTQYADAFQRANFWNKVKHASYAKYHTVLRIAEVTPVQTIDVPAEDGATMSGPCAPIGEVNFTYFDVQINSLIASLGIQPNTLPIFLDYNVFETANGCCILGYHGVRGANQVYGVSAYSDPGIFPAPGIQDIHALSHEIAEIYDDPYAGNNTPRWQSQYAPQYGCNNFLEVADPLVGSALPVTLGGFTYHTQELAFKAWFAKKVPSNAVNGWYSFNQTLLSPSPVC